MATNQSVTFFEHQVYKTSREVPFSQLRIVGKGSIGIVEEVEGTAGPFRDRVYARKTILLDELQDRELGVSEIEKEVKVLKQLQHQHIIQLITTYLFRNNYAIIIDPLAERNLEQSFQRTIVSPAWFGCLLSGVIYTHKSGICHRDIKPHNILINKMNILLTDFGISMRGIGETVSTTKPGEPRGRTPEYCAPEVQRGHTRRRSADIFSLGAVFLEMLTVYSYPDGLEKLRGRLETADGYSYALNVPKVNEWIDILEDKLLKDSWQPSIIYLCRNMLKMSHDLRPQAEDLRLWWSHQETSDIPPIECTCGQSFG